MKRTLKLIEIDPWLEPYEDQLRHWNEQYIKRRLQLLGDRALISDFANGHLYYGFHQTESGWIYREKAPAADALHLIGDFNDWNRMSHPMTKRPGGDWEIYLPGRGALRDGGRVLVQVRHKGRSFDRVPAYITSAVQDQHHQYAGCIRDKAPYEWQTPDKPRRAPDPLYIYECHIGMAQEKEGVGSYQEFIDEVLPRIKSAGYNAIQLMAVMEHAYYASFGYHVTNFFAASTWYGDGDGLKALIDRAHALGMRVFMDLVHAHASTNARDGIADFDGSSALYCKGEHPQWGSALFDYGKPETLHFLLSNLKYWLSEYRFDGFRFDGVTSMLYHDHAMGKAFASYDDYFGANVNCDALFYLKMATELIREVNPQAVAIAEDMSGFPGMCLPVKWGGVGFQYRLNMGVPDFWIKTLKEQRDEQWDMRALWHEMTTRRPYEKVVGYAESHDQALVGDKTLIFQLMDAEMYRGMEKSYHSESIDRAVALHKLIKLITWALAGDAYLNFMGNEFGHPEWVDFPREGNDWSYRYARRQWSLRDNGQLKYEWLADFDRDMLRLGRQYKPFLNRPARSLWIDQQKKVVAFEKGKLVFLFNFHATRSYLDCRIGGLLPGAYRVCFDSDAPEYGGYDRISREVVYDAPGGELVIYAPARCALVLEMV